MKKISTVLLVFVCALCSAQTSFDVKEVDGKTIVVQSNVSEVTITSAELDKQISEIDKQIQLLTEQKNVFLDLYRKIKAIEDKKPENK